MSTAEMQPGKEVLEMAGKYAKQRTGSDVVSCFPNRSGMSLADLRDRMEIATDLLFDLAYSYFAHHELTQQHALRMRRCYKTKGAQNLASELYILHSFLEMLSNITAPSMEVVRQLLQDLKTESLPKPKRLRVPKTNYADLRRDFLKGLFNAIRPKGETRARVDLRLGDVLFISDDDYPKS